MSVLLDEDFEGGTNSATVSTGNTDWSFVNGSPTFTNADPFTGALSMSMVTTTSALHSTRYDFTASGTAWVRLAFRLTSIPTGNLYIAQLAPSGSTSNLIDFRVTDSMIDFRVASTKVWDGAAALAEDTWYQAVMGVSGSSAYFELYDAAGTLIEQSGAKTYGGGNVGRVYVGIVQQLANVDLQVDAVVVENATKPDPIITEDESDGGEPSDGGTVLLDEGFEGGSNGNTVTTGNSGFSNINGSPTFTNSNPFEGSLSGSFVTTTSALHSCRYDADEASGTMWVRLAFRVNTMPSGNLYLCQLSPSGSATSLVDFRLTDSMVDMRVASTKVWDGSYVVAEDRWYQAIIGVAGSAAYFELYDEYGQLLDSSGPRTYSGGDVGRVYTGIIAQVANCDVQIDSLLVDAGTKPSAIESEPPPVTASFTHYAVTEEGLVPLLVSSVDE